MNKFIQVKCFWETGYNMEAGMHCGALLDWYDAQCFIDNNNKSIANVISQEFVSILKPLP